MEKSSENNNTINNDLKLKDSIQNSEKLNPDTE
jgi:hypothetical protein